MFKSVSNLFIKLPFFGSNKEENKSRLIIDYAKKVGKNEKELLMMQSVLKLKSTNARDVMIPRVDVQAININNEKELLELLEHDSYSRIPIYEGEIDNMLGILHTKDFYLEKIKRGKADKKVDIRKLLNPAYFIPESKSIFTLLAEMQLKHIHMALVVDEYGGFSGIITMEDIIEEIIGDIQDEFDREKQVILKLDDDVYSVDARVSLNDLPKHLSVKSSHEEVETLAGYILSELGYIPKLNQRIIIHGMEYQIIEKRKNSLIRIKIKSSKKDDLTNEAEIGSAGEN